MERQRLQLSNAVVLGGLWRTSGLLHANAVCSVLRLYQVFLANAARAVPSEVFQDVASSAVD